VGQNSGPVSAYYALSPGGFSLPVRASEKYPGDGRPAP
jgi:hypothetical protein